MRVCARLSAEAAITQSVCYRKTSDHGGHHSINGRTWPSPSVLRPSVRMFSPLNVCLRGRQGQDRSQIDRQALAGRLRLSLHYAASARAHHSNTWRKFHVKNELIEFGSSSRRHMHILLSKID